MDKQQSTLSPFMVKGPSSASGHGERKAAELSAYEQQRLRNIARNNQVLVELGLASPAPAAPRAPGPLIQ